MSAYNKKFTVGMRRQIIVQCLHLIASDDGLTRYRHDVLNSEAAVVMGCDVLLDYDPTNTVASPREQWIASEWRRRREEAIGLGKRMRLFKSMQFMVRMPEATFPTSRYVTTRFGRLFRGLPTFLQCVLIAMVCAFGRISKAATRFRWIASIVSFVMLAGKILHSGAISTAWIALSLVVGLAIASVASLLD
jgi:hypothetical protein